MYKFLLRSKWRFSNMIIPYYPKGFHNVSQNQEAELFVSEGLSIKDLYGFSFAFTNLLDSIDQSDFFDYAKEVCDKSLAEAFYYGIQQIQNEQLKLEKVVFDEQKEEVIPHGVSILISLDQKESIYQQEQIYKMTRRDVTTFTFNGDNKNVNIVLDMYIRSKISLIVEGQKYNPDNYHLVRFLAVKDEQPTNFIEILKRMIFREQQTLFLGKNPEWKIIDIDNFMLKKYPEILQ